MYLPYLLYKDKTRIHRLKSISSLRNVRSKTTRKKNINIILHFKLSPCSEYCRLSSEQLPGVLILYANVSEHCLFHLHRRVIMKILHTSPSMTTEQTEFSETSEYKMQTHGKYPEESTQQT